VYKLIAFGSVRWFICRKVRVCVFETTSNGFFLCASHCDVLCLRDGFMF